ncbi:MAG: hypothetical protein OEX04_04870 [Acidimicrobiia bacterium]|nr:hypothetical protein [Acidimicrobiia bacterium]MDH5292368.1 hypothetical protein [Acidimicrobiia bacterium]
MEDLAVKFADFLESIASKVRSLTVDRARKVLTIVALAIPAIVLGSFAIVFLFMTIHGALAIPLGRWGAYAVEAGLFAAVGAFLWAKRTTEEHT